jgi:hypothetical protein
MLQIPSLLGGERAPNEADLQLFQAGYDETVRRAQEAGYKPPTPEEFAVAVSGPRLRAGDNPDIYADWFGSLFEPEKPTMDLSGTLGGGGGDSGNSVANQYTGLVYDPANKTFVQGNALSAGDPYRMRDYYGYTGG